MTICKRVTMSGQPCKLQSLKGKDICHVHFRKDEGIVKSTQFEVDVREAKVYQMLQKGVTRAEVVQLCANEWGVTERQAYNYIDGARKKLGSQLSAHFFVIGEDVGVNMKIAVKTLLTIVEDDEANIFARLQAIAQITRLWARVTEYAEFWAELEEIKKSLGKDDRS